MIYLIRHGETAHNKEHKIQGQNDVPLSDAGRAEIREKAALFDGVHFSKVISSPLSRALETAEILFENAEVDEFLTDARLIEFDFGENTGRQITEIIEAEDEEDTESFYSRIAQVLIEAALTEGNVALVTHGRVIGTLLRTLDEDLVGQFFPLPNLSVQLIDSEVDGEVLKIALKNINATDDELRESFE